MAGLCAQNTIFPDFEALYETRMLAHHAYTQGKRVSRSGKTPFFPVNEYGSRRRGEVAGEYVHERGFSCSVLSQKSVYLTGAQTQGGL
jgi:hypothetical protein